MDYFPKYLLILLIIIGIAYLIYKSILIKQSRELLNYSYVTKSPLGKFIVGFAEDCKGRITVKVPEVCYRMVYFFDENGNKGTCFVGEDHDAQTEMFNKIRTTWRNEYTLLWASEYSNFQNRELSLRSFGDCDPYDIVMDHFELFPTLTDSIDRIETQKEDEVKQEEERIYQEAIRDIDVDNL